MAVPIVSIFATGDYDAQIHRGIDLITAGGVVILPTETVYGAATLLGRSEGRQRLLDLRGGETRRSPFISPGRKILLTIWMNKRIRQTSDSQALARPGGAVVWRSPDGVKKWRGGWVSQSQTCLTTLELRCGARNISGIRSDRRCRRADGNHRAVGSPVGFDVVRLRRRHSSRRQSRFDIRRGPTKYSKPSTLSKWRRKLSDRAPRRLRRADHPPSAANYDSFRLQRQHLPVPDGRSPCPQHPGAQLDVPEPDLERKGISVISAGSYAVPGAKATPQAVAAVKGFGADLSHHHSRPLTVELIHQADMIYTMSQNHAHQVMALVPSASEKVATLDPAGKI